MLSDPALTSNVLGIQSTLDHVFWREGEREGRKERRREGGKSTISSLRL